MQSSLIHTTVEFDVEYVLRSMIEYTRRKIAVYPRHMEMPETRILGFGLGRQSGQTTAIENIANDEVESTLILVPNDSMVRRSKATLSCLSSHAFCRVAGNIDYGKPMLFIVDVASHPNHCSELEDMKRQRLHLCTESIWLEVG